LSIGSKIEQHRLISHLRDLPAIAQAGFDASVSNETEVSSSAQETTDFVWAVRLARISKGLIDRMWSHETFFKGATFSLDDEVEEGQQIFDALKSEGFEGFKKVDITSKDDVFIVGSD
jgi:hypothetical protein